MNNCIPTAIVLSIRETHDNVPGFSSTAGLPLLELGLDEDVVTVAVFPALNCTILTDGRLYRISICGSGLDADLDADCGGRLNERFTAGVVGAVAEAIFINCSPRLDPLCA